MEIVGDVSWPPYPLLNGLSKAGHLLDLYVEDIVAVVVRVFVFNIQYPLSLISWIYGIQCRVVSENYRLRA